MNVIQAEVHALPKETETPANKTLMVNMPPTGENNKECEIVHVEEGESIKEMLDKKVNYGNKMKYTDGRVNRTKNARKKESKVGSKAENDSQTKAKKDDCVKQMVMTEAECQ